MDYELTAFNLGDGILGFAVAGELDLLTAPELQRRLNEAIDAGEHRLLLDLTAATFLDSTTLGVLMGAVKRLALVGGALAIVCDNPNIVTIFEITELDTVLDIFGSTEAAIALLQDLENGAASDDLTLST